MVRNESFLFALLFVTCVLAFLVLVPSPSPAFASAVPSQEQDSPASERQGVDPQTEPVEPDEPPAAQEPESPAVDEPEENIEPKPAGPPMRKSFIIPALDIVLFEGLLNLVNRRLDDSGTYDVTWDSIRDNAHGPWVVDDDLFAINQLFHPYQGAVYQNLARSAGLNFWQSSVYTFFGSVLWEIAGETTPPSRNDQIASGIGGNFLGEPLFRMANMVLGNGEREPGFWRELAAAGISPGTGFNRAVFGDRFDTIFDARDPAYYSRLQIGASTTTQSAPGTSTRLHDDEGVTDFSMEYGLPGKPGYSYRRPFDYFSFQIIVSSGQGFESVLTRGTILAADYGSGDRGRGLWGLYGIYDYIAPQTFRVSTTALAVGTTFQWNFSGSTSLQGTALLGVGYGAVGTLNGVDENDYHYGVAPQALLATRLNFSDHVSLDLNARDWFVTNVAAADTGGHDNIARADASLTFRLLGKQAVALRYQWNHREATYADLEDRTQSRSTIGIFYTRLGRDRFGAVDWRR